MNEQPNTTQARQESTLDRCGYNIQNQLDLELVAELRRAFGDEPFDVFAVNGTAMVDERLGRAIDRAAPSARYKKGNRQDLFKRDVLAELLEDLAPKFFEFTSRRGSWKAKVARTGSVTFCD